LKLSILLHPDRNRDDPTANEKFDQLKKAYDILYDEKRRKRYDLYGDTEEINVNALYQYTINRVSKKDVKSYLATYKGSKEEEADLVAFYEEYGGDLTYILECIIGSESEDVPRFIQIYERLIKEGTIDREPQFDKTKASVKALPDEKDEAKKEKQRRKKKKEE